MGIKAYKPRDPVKDAAYATLDAVAVVGACGFLVQCAPLAKIEGRARVLLSLEQRRFLYESFSQEEQTRVRGFRGIIYLGGGVAGEVILTGKFSQRGEKLAFIALNWDSAENLWCDVEALLSRERGKFTTHGASLLWLLLNEAARRAGIKVETPAGEVTS